MRQMAIPCIQPLPIGHVLTEAPAIYYVNQPAALGPSSPNEAGAGFHGLAVSSSHGVAAKR